MKTLVSSRLWIPLFVLLTTSARAEEPKVVAIWPSGPMEVRLAFDRAVDPARVQALEGRTIDFHARSSTNQPGPLRGSIRIAGARLTDDDRLAILATDPHPIDGVYVLSDPTLPRPLTYSLRGVEATWTPENGGDGWSGWWPALDPEVVRKALSGSVEHARELARLDQPGRLELRTFLELPEGASTLRLTSNTEFETSINFEAITPQQTAPGFQAEVPVESSGEAVECSISVPTGPKPPTLSVALRQGHEGPFEPLSPSAHVLPWAPTPAPAAPSAPEPGFDLAGGDPAQGAQVFRSEEAKCNSCHRLGGEGGDIGPSLDALKDRPLTDLYRDIAEPSAVINPEYQPFTVALKDGQVLVGVVRAEGLDRVRISDISAKTTVISRSDIEEIRPSTASVMPVGLAGALGEQKMRDLLAYLKHPTP